jgi:ABC-type multidrug transport system permease subunit
MYRIQSVRVARSALVLTTLTASLQVIAFSVAFASRLVIAPIFRWQPTSPPDNAAILVLLPVVFVVTWLFFYPMSALFLFLYNQVAKVTGGVEFSAF